MEASDPQIRLYVQAMQFHAHNALYSLERKKEIIERNKTALRSADCQLALFNEQQNILAQASAVSRYFWPSRRSSEARGSALRECLSIAGGDPLYDRSLRNALEHYDERLDAFLSENGSQNYVTEFYGNRSDLPADSCFLKAFFVDQDVFYVLGEEYSFSPIILSIGELNTKITEYLKRV